MSRLLYCLIILSCCLFIEESGFSQTGFFYDEPAGGWNYFFNGDAAAGGPRRSNLPTLDGSWRHENNSDEWDGDGRGAGIDAAGGISASGGVLTMEDAVTLSSGTNNNRKLYLTHDLKQDGVVANNVLDTGVTLFFRARLTPPPGEIVSGQTNTDGSYLPNGYGVFSDGKGMFGIRQSNPSSIISFSLVRATEDFQPSGSPLNLTFQNSGLLLNKLNGDLPGAAVDANEIGGVTNLLALDPAQWHEFWITIQANDATPGNGTHTVRIYLDGSAIPVSFNVTAGTGSDVDTNTVPAWTDYIALGLNNSPTVGAFDTDFYAFKAGVHIPLAVDPTAPVGFAQQPASLTLNEGQMPVFSVTVTGAPPRTIQWQRSNGVGGFTNLIGATATIYEAPPVVASDNGSKFRALAANPFSSATSAVATLTVDADVTRPTVLIAQTIDSFFDVFVTFSEAVTPASANNTVNYTMDGGLNVIGAGLLPDSRTVRLRLSNRMAEGTSYHLTLNGVRDASIAGNEILPNTMTMFQSPVLQSGFVRREFYDGIVGSAVSSLVTAPAFLVAPTTVGVLAATESPLNVGDNYGQRLSGYLVPPESGNYTFYLSSDDQSQLWLSTDENPWNASLACSETSAGGPRMWTGDRTGGTRTNPPPADGIAYNIRTNVPLVAGRLYYFFVAHKEAVGSDHVGVTWQLPSQTSPPTNGSPSALTGSNVALASPAGIITFSEQPSDQTNFQSRPVTFVVSVVLDRPELVASYQWQRSDNIGGFTNIPGAVARSYTLPVIATADDQSQFRVRVVAPGASAISAAATLTVIPDISAPEPQLAGSLDGTGIGLCFDELLDAASATNLVNYQVQHRGNFVPVQSAILLADGRRVQLQLATPIDESFAVTIGGVRDFVLNTMPTPVTLNGRVRGLASLDVGSVARVGRCFSCDNEAIEIAGSGADVWGTGDQFRLVHANVAGDFDARVRVTTLRGSNALAKAVLVARESTSSGSRGLHISVSPPPPGRDQFEPGQRVVTDGSTASWGAKVSPAGVPDAWLRITRVGNLFSSFWGSNGVEWALLDQSVQIYPPVMVVGIGVTAHDNSLLATGSFSNFQILQSDFGDAPPPYPTRLANLGASHLIRQGYFLGIAVDGEADGQPDNGATGDDASSADDENGVSLPFAFVPGNTATIQVRASASGFLDGWIDFGADGSWATPGDRIFTSQALSSGTNTLSVAVPSGAVLGTTYARFRFSSAGGLSFTGAAQDGEVEDYAVLVAWPVDLALRQSATQNPVAVGDNIAYTIEVTNLSATMASGVTVSNRLSPFVGFISASAGCSHASGMVTCVLPDLAPGGLSSVSVVASVTAAGSLTNVATVSAASPDGNSANNSALLVTRAAVRPTLVNVGYSVGALTAQFQTSNGEVYALEYKDNLNEPQWLTLTTILGDGTVKSFTDSNPPGLTRFYRLVLQ